MISASLPQQGRALSGVSRWGLVADVTGQVALCGSAGLLPSLLSHASNASIDHAFTVLSSGIAIAAAILVALGSWLSTSGQAVRITFAILSYEVFLLVEAVEPGPATQGQLIRDLAMICVAVLCGLAVRRVDVAGRALRTSVLITSAVVIGSVIVSRLPDTAALDRIQPALDVSTWAVSAVTGLALVCCGIRGHTPLLRRIGLALLMLTAAPVLKAAQALPVDQPSLIPSALGLAGVAMLLGAAVPFAVGALRTVWRELAESQSRLQAAEQAMANSAVRDHEMRNLVAGLSGAESVLAAYETDESSPEGHRQLRAVARAELDRLRRMLDSEGVGLEPSGPSSVAVAPLLKDLAALHGTTGAAIELTVPDDLQALVPPECLAHIVTNLLVNCARHAPGARVWLTASRRADYVVIKVTDDGPGLPPGSPAELLRPGTRGPSSVGTGLGLHVSAELASRHGGTIRLEPTLADGRGCTVVVVLPAASAGSWPLEQVGV